MTAIGKRALVTGASAGIGRAFAQRLATDGYDLILVARRREKLEALAEELQQSAGVNAEVIVADLTKPEDLLRVEDAARDVSLLINNAGFGAYQPFVVIEPDVAEDLVRVHVLATVRLSRAALPNMVARGSGGIINVASLLAFSGSLPPDRLPYRAIYAGGKAFVVTFTQALAGELADTGVMVSVCCPGVIATEFHDVQGIDMTHLARMQPEEVVHASLAALQRGEVVCIPALDSPEALEQLSEIQRTLIFSANASVAAARYRESS